MKIPPVVDHFLAPFSPSQADFLILFLLSLPSIFFSASPLSCSSEIPTAVPLVFLRLSTLIWKQIPVTDGSSVSIPNLCFAKPLQVFFSASAPPPPCLILLPPRFTHPKLAGCDIGVFSPASLGRFTIFPEVVTVRNISPFPT